MKKICEKYELLELFDDYRVIEREVKKVEYWIDYDDNMSFEFLISPYEDYVCIDLIDNTTKTIIFSICIHNLEEIVCKEKKLFLYKENQLGEPFLVIQIRPTFSLSSLSI